MEYWMDIEYPRFKPFIFQLTPSLEILRCQFIRIISKAVITDSWAIILHRICYWEGFLDIIWDRIDEIRSQYICKVCFPPCMVDFSLWAQKRETYENIFSFI